MDSLKGKKLSLDKSNWKSVKFGDVVAEPKESVKDIEGEGIEHVVGLEHIDSENIHLRRSAGIEESTTFTKKFSKGNVLFGRRRAYLKKAALANFSGICSGDITVMRVKDGLIPYLLPFIVQNDKFFDYAVKHSAGGLSPRVKFKDLANYEFLLPPKDQQIQLVELLWAMDEVIEKELEVLEKLNTTLNSFVKQVFTSHIFEQPTHQIKVKSPFQTKWEHSEFPKGWTSILLKDTIRNSQNGFAEGKRDSDGIAQLRMNNVTRSGRIDLSSIAMVPSRKNISNYIIENNDVMFCNTNSEDLVGKSVIAGKEIEGFTFSNHFTRLRTNKKILLPKFLYLWLKYHFDIGLFESLCTRWIGQAAVQTESLLRLFIVLPPISEQEYVSNCTNEIEERIQKVDSLVESTKQLQKSLINTTF
jgi:type I restriction enzyme, S subunit